MNIMKQVFFLILAFYTIINCYSQTSDKYFNRGIANAKSKNYAAAISEFDKAIEINPRDADSYYNRGFIKWTLKKYQSAIADFDKAIEINPKLTIAYYNR